MGISDRTSTLGQARWLRWLVVAALILLYTGWIGYVAGQDKPLDFYVYYSAAYGFAHGINMYGAIGANATAWANLAQTLQIHNYTLPYLYPPLTAMLAWPLTLLPPRWAALVWLIASALAFAASAWLIGRSFGSPFSVTLALTLLLFFVPPLTTLHAGQVNGFLLLTLAFVLYAFACKRPAWLGTGLAVGTMLKLVPVAHLGYLAWRRQWRAAIIGVIVIVLLLGSAIPLIGWSGLASYARNFFTLGSAGNLITAGASQSFSSFFARLLVAEGGRRYLADAPQLARWLGWGTSLLLVAATMALCWPRGDLSNLFSLEFSLVTTAISLLTPYVWYHQLVLLLIPFFVLAERALIHPNLRWMLIPLAIGYVVTDIHGLAWHRLEFNPLLVSMPFYTALMLWGLLAWLIVREKWRSATGETMR
jgi:hypothetical protein